MLCHTMSNGEVIRVNFVKKIKVLFRTCPMLSLASLGLKPRSQDLRNVLVKIVNMVSTHNLGNYLSQSLFISHADWSS